MTDKTRQGFTGANGAIAEALDAAGASLDAFVSGPGQAAADVLGASFEEAAERMTLALARAGASGEVTFKKLANVAFAELAKIALSEVLGAPGGGGRTDRSAASGDSFGLFGEGERGGSSSRGFGVPSVNVSFHVSGGDISAVQRNSSQIAAQVARAVALGSRYL